MASKEEWKETGKGLGGAFTKLAKTTIRSVKAGVEKAEEWAESDENNPVQHDSNVFNDGSWRETGKELGGAFEKLWDTVTNNPEESDKQE